MSDSAFALEARTPQCLAPALSTLQAPQYRTPGCPDHGQLDGTHDVTATLKVPQWHASAPYIDVSLRSWRDAPRDGSDAAAASGSAAEIETTQVVGPYQLVAGYSQPLASINSGAWQSAWAGASVRLAPGTRLRFLVEASRELHGGARDTRYTVHLGRALSDTLRLSAFMSHAPDDQERRWRAGLGWEWTF